MSVHRAAIERQLIVGIRRRLARDHCLQQALRHQVGVAAVGRRRVRVILHREAEVPLWFPAGLFQHILAGTEQLDHRQRQIGKMIGILLLLLTQKIMQRFRIGIGGKFGPHLRGDFHDPVPALGRFHHAPNGGQTLRLERTRDHAIGGDHEILDQLRGAILHLRIDFDAAVFEPDRLCLDRFQIQRPVARSARARRRCAMASWR